MMSQERLDAIAINAVIDGKNAQQVSSQTGVPVQRVQLAMTRARGKDPKQVARLTRKKRRQSDQQVFRDSYVSPHLIRDLRK